jgi:cysteine-rich repeat protein
VGLRCGFTQSAYVEDAMAPHIGFRCCSTCGNGTIEPWETCDYALDPTHCHPAHCGPLTCGNGTTEAGEECDDGNLFTGDGCSPACLIETVCGDGVREGSEDCDDGNSIPWDGCSPLCTTEVTVLTEDFKPCPTTWTFVNGGATTTAWACDKLSGVDLVIVIFQSTSGTQDGLITPVLDLSAYSGVQLEYTQWYNDPAVAGGDQGEVQYSLNGTAGPWTTLSTQTATIAANPVKLDVSVTAHQANVAFRFYYVHSSGANDYWALNNITVRAY